MCVQVLDRAYAKCFDVDVRRWVVDVYGILWCQNFYFFNWVGFKGRHGCIGTRNSKMSKYEQGIDMTYQKVISERTIAWL